MFKWLGGDDKMIVIEEGKRLTVLWEWTVSTWIEAIITSTSLLDMQ